MASATLDLISTLSGILGDGSPHWRWTTTSPKGECDTIDFASGNNTITIPTGTTLVVIEPPSDNTQALLLKGATGDTGIDCDPNSPIVVSPSTAETTIVVNAAGIVTGVKVWIF